MSGRSHVDTRAACPFFADFAHQRSDEGSRLDYCPSTCGWYSTARSKWSVGTRISNLSVSQVARVRKCMRSSERKWRSRGFSCHSLLSGFTSLYPGQAREAILSACGNMGHVSGIVFASSALLPRVGCRYEGFPAWHLDISMPRVASRGATFLQ